MFSVTFTKLDGNKVDQEHVTLTSGAARLPAGTLATIAPSRASVRHLQYYRSPEARARRVAKALEDAALLAERLRPRGTNDSARSH